MSLPLLEEMQRENTRLRAAIGVKERDESLIRARMTWLERRVNELELELAEVRQHSMVV
jgi:hypothetical protein